MANERGEVTPKLTKHILELVEGGVGLIIAGHASVHLSGRTSPNQLGIYSDTHLPGLKKLVEKVHQKSGKIVSQLNHGGAHSNQNASGSTPISSSVNHATSLDCRKMTHKDIEKIVESFRDASIRAKKAGFDGVQVHAAHGYLLSQFLSPIYNERKDEYGGNISNRSRFAVNVYNKIRMAVGDEYPVMIKMNVTDFLDEGITQDEALKAATIFDTIGYDGIELSGGVIWGWRTYGLKKSPCKTGSAEAYFLEIAKLLKKRINMPVILTGGIKSYDLADQIVSNGDADYIGLCRPLIREPDLINRWKSGDTSPSLCIYDSACLSRSGEIRCSQLP
jgi:2,4-dienoyl-CoA reductase-like NADH-dependent reductase (Old Yellow Enzyme family)